MAMSRKKVEDLETALDVQRALENSQKETIEELQARTVYLEVSISLLLSVSLMPKFSSIIAN